MKTIITIISQVENNLKIKESIKLIEEYADCLIKIMKAIQEDVEDDTDDSDNEEKTHNIEKIRVVLKKEVFSRIQPLTARNADNIGLSNKARFTFLDIYESIQKF